MPVVRVTSRTLLFCALLAAGCRSEPPLCPQSSLTVDPEVIPNGKNQSSVTVEVTEPPFDRGIEIVTELHAESGAIADPSARETTFTCAHDVSGPVEICVTTTYSDDGGNLSSEANGVGSAQASLRGPNVYLVPASACNTVECTEVICPEVKNQCPEVSSLTVEPEVLAVGDTATVSVTASDPDGNPGTLVTTLTARHGTIADPNAAETTYHCDPNVGGVIEICVTASDGDSSCDVERCTTVRCPGDPLENTCPIIESLTATPMTIPLGETTTEIAVSATDPDDFPVPIRTELSADTGVFGDRFASNTTFTCGDAGPVEICVKANDGDPACDETQCMTVQCPSDIPANVCPMLFVINGVPRVIPEGQNSTSIETRAQDTDGLPFPLTLTLQSLWGSFENTENIQQPNNVVAQDATYVCDRPGGVEVCVDATDGACTKTLCDNVVCPDDIPTPP